MRPGDWDGVGKHPGQGLARGGPWRLAERVLHKIQELSESFELSKTGK